jgi:transposase
MTRAEYWIGVDLHSRVIQVCVIDAQGQVVFEQRSKGDGLAEGRELVNDLAVRFPEAHVAVEALGCNRWFVASCREAGLQVLVANASKLQLKRAGKKTDRRDAYEMARRLRLGDIARNAKTYHPTDEEYGLRQLLRRRHGLVQMRTSSISQIRAMLRSHRAPQPRGDLYGRQALKTLRETPLANALETAVLRTLLDLLEALHAAVRDLDRLVDSESRKGASAGLRLLPYAGPQTAATLVAELGDAHRFRNSKAAGSYAGLVPRLIESGQRSYHGPLVNHGNRELRFVLGEWAVQLMARHELVKQWAEPRLRRSPKNKVRVALARRLLVGVWHTLRTGEVFDLKRCLALS